MEMSDKRFDRLRGLGLASLTTKVDFDPFARDVLYIYDARVLHGRHSEEYTDITIRSYSQEQAALRLESILTDDNILRKLKDLRNKCASDISNFKIGDPKWQDALANLISIDNVLALLDKI